MAAGLMTLLPYILGYCGNIYLIKLCNRHYAGDGIHCTAGGEGDTFYLCGGVPDYGRVFGGLWVYGPEQILKYLRHLFMSSKPAAHRFAFFPAQRKLAYLFKYP
jgi:hypothetical protein